MEPREEDIFINQTSTLWKLAHQMPPYQCSSNCKAPSRFYIGEPWINMGGEAIEEGQVNLEINCKIWDGIAAGTDRNSDEVRWTFNGEPLLIKDKNRDPIISRIVSNEKNLKCYFSFSFSAASNVWHGSVSSEHGQRKYVCSFKVGDQPCRRKEASRRVPVCKQPRKLILGALHSVLGSMGELVFLH